MAPTLDYIVGQLQLVATINPKKAMSGKIDIAYNKEGNEDVYSFEDSRYKVSVATRSSGESGQRTRAEKLKGDWSATDKKALGKGSVIEGNKAAFFEY